MSIDFFIQDFVNSWKLRNSEGGNWRTLVSGGNYPAGIASFQSGNEQHLARITCTTLPDKDWRIVELWMSAADVQNDLRLDCLRMTSQQTHTDVQSQIAPAFVQIELKTRHPGVNNMCFLVYLNSSPPTNPWLCAVHQTL